MPAPISHIDPKQRFAEKEASRRADEEALRSGRKSVAQLKHANEAFAFSPSEACVNWEQARSVS
jgi:hypothetical protein